MLSWIVWLKKKLKIKLILIKLIINKLFRLPFIYLKTNSNYFYVFFLKRPVTEIIMLLKLSFFID